MNKFLLLSFIVYSSFSHAQKRGTLTLNKNIIINWEIQKFEKSAHTFKYCTKNNSRILCKIDNEEWFGSDIGTELPKNYLKKLTVLIDGAKIDLETSKMYNPNFSGLLHEQQYKLKIEKQYYMLYGYFSDGGGSYTAHWKIENHIGNRILISKNEEHFQWQVE